MNNPDNLPDRAYFITLCAYQSQPILGNLINGQVGLSEAGRIASMCWLGIPDHMPEVHLDAFIIMPNHFHGILKIHGTENSKLEIRNSKFTLTETLSLSTILRSFKAAATRRVNHLNDTPGASLWQPSYHARIVKSQPALEAFRHYIRDNPASWLSDPLNPDGDRPAPFCPVPLSMSD